MIEVARGNPAPGRRKIGGEESLRGRKKRGWKNDRLESRAGNEAESDVFGVWEIRRFTGEM